MEALKRIKSDNVNGVVHQLVHLSSGWQLSSEEQPVIKGRVLNATHASTLPRACVIISDGRRSISDSIILNQVALKGPVCTDCSY